MRLTCLAAAMAAALTVAVIAQAPATKALPLDNLGLEHLDIVVPDPAASAAFYSRIFKSALHQQPVRDTLRYRLVYGAAAERPRDSNGRVWFELDRRTRIGLEEAPPGVAPSIAHYTIKVAPFDRAALETRLRDINARVLPSPDEPDVVRFADNNGISVEVRVAQ